MNCGMSDGVGRCLPSSHPWAVEAGTSAIAAARRIDRPARLRAAAICCVRALRLKGGSMWTTLKGVI